MYSKRRIMKVAKAVVPSLKISPEVYDYIDDILTYETAELFNQIATVMEIADKKILMRKKAEKILKSFGINLEMLRTFRKQIEEDIKGGQTAR